MKGLFLNQLNQKLHSFLLLLFPLLWGLLCSFQLSAQEMGKGKGDCEREYIERINVVRNGWVRYLLTSAKKYEDTWSMIKDAKAGNKSAAILAFHQTLSKMLAGQKKIAPSVDNMMDLLVDFNKYKILCNPRAVSYKTILKNYDQYVEQVAAQKLREIEERVREQKRIEARILAEQERARKEAERLRLEEEQRILEEIRARRPAKVKIIDQIQEHYKKKVGCLPYKSNFDIDLNVIGNLANKSTQAAQRVACSDPTSHMKPCGVCYDEMDSCIMPNFKKCGGCQSSGMQGCEDCVRKHYSGLIKSGDFPKQCMFCNGKLSAKELYDQGVLNRDEIIDWQHQELMEAALACPDFVKCTSGKCPNGHFKSEKDYKKFLEDGCKYCGTKNFCKDCGRSYHPGKSCKQVWSDWVDECDKIGSSACPNCWTSIQRDGGCVHMTCPKCKTNFSDITKLPYDPKKGNKDYDVGGFPIKYFYPGGGYKEGARHDQKGRNIDVDGNLVQNVNRTLHIDGQDVQVPTPTIVGRDGASYYEYDASENRAWKLVPPHFHRGAEVPKEMHYLFKGEWDQIAAKIKEDRHKELLRNNGK